MRKPFDETDGIRDVPATNDYAPKQYSAREHAAMGLKTS